MHKIKQHKLLIIYFGLIVFCASFFFASFINADLNTGLAAHWKLNNSMADSSGNGNTLTNDGTESTAGLYGANDTAYKINGINDESLIASDSSSLDITGDISIAGWLNISKPFTASEWQITLVGKWNGATNNRSYFLYASEADSISDGLIFGISSDGTGEGNGQDLYVSDFTTNFATGTWHHFAVTWDASESRAKFYMNGKKLGGDKIGSKTQIYNGNASLKVAYSGDYNGDYSVDEVRLYNKVLNDNEIRALSISPDYNNDNVVNDNDIYDQAKIQADWLENVWGAEK
ncbi:MAG: LamG-like jellyroll fold domain-containing protein [Candidatus Falkowbacteria bacterium]